MKPSGPRPLKRKSHRRCHEARDRGRCADHRHECAGMGEQMHRSPGRRRHGKEGEEARRAEAARDRRAECQQPHAVQSEMRPVAMNECVGDEGPDVGAEAAWHVALRNNGRVEPRRNEGEPEQEVDILLLGQDPDAYHMHEHHQRKHRHHDGGHVEDRFVPRARLGRLLIHRRHIGRAHGGGKPRRSQEKREGLRPPFPNSRPTAG